MKIIMLAKGRRGFNAERLHHEYQDESVVS
jgi:hypothetical protein